jgi:hypothetical protein
MTSGAIQEFLEAVEAGNLTSCGALAPGVVLDATVPNWRFSTSGADEVRAELGRWYAHPGRFEELHRQPIDDGEVVEFTLTWEEHGVPHACHQVHVLAIDDGAIISDRVWCGGRWPASLLAEMGDRAGTGG